MRFQAPREWNIRHCRLPWREQEMQGRNQMRPSVRCWTTVERGSSAYTEAEIVAEDGTRTAK